MKYGQQVDTGEVVAMKASMRTGLGQGQVVQGGHDKPDQARDCHHERSPPPPHRGIKEVMAFKDKIYMVMEFMPGGELFDKIVAEGPPLQSQIMQPRLRAINSSLAVYLQKETEEVELSWNWSAVLGLDTCLRQS